jgi:hypothetical protein
VLSRALGVLFYGVVQIAVEFERAHGGARSRDQRLHLRGIEPNRVRAPVGEAHHARPVLEDVPAIGSQPLRVVAGDAECGAAGAERQANAGGARAVDRGPDIGVHDAVGANEGAVDVGAEKSDHGEGS